MDVIFLDLDDFREYIREENIDLDTGEDEWKMVGQLFINPSSESILSLQIWPY